MRLTRRATTIQTTCTDARGPPKRTSTPARDDDDSDDDGASSQEVFQRLAGLVRGKKTGNADDPQPHRDGGERRRRGRPRGEIV